MNWLVYLVVICAAAVLLTAVAVFFTVKSSVGKLHAELEQTRAELPNLINTAFGLNMDDRILQSAVWRGLTALASSPPKSPSAPPYLDVVGQRLELILARQDEQASRNQATVEQLVIAVRSGSANLTKMDQVFANFQTLVDQTTSICKSLETAILKERAEAEDARRAGAEALAQAQAVDREGSKSRADAADSLASIQRLYADLEAREKLLRDQETCLKENKVQAEKASAESQRLLAEARLAQAALAETTQKLEERERRIAQNVQSASDMIARSERMAVRQWPEIFREAGPLAKDRLEILKNIDEGQEEAAILEAALARLSAVWRSSNQQDLMETLSEVGRSAYRYWKTSLPPVAVAEHAQRWATVLAGGLNSNITIKVARPGSPKDRQWMNYNPGGASQVMDAANWALLNSRGSPFRSAEVS